MNTKIDPELHLNKDFKGKGGYTVYIWRLKNQRCEGKWNGYASHPQGYDFYAGSTSATIQDRLKTPKNNQEFIINAKSVELVAIKEVESASPDQIKREEQIAINTVAKFCRANEKAKCLNSNRSHKEELKISIKLYNKIVSVYNAENKRAAEKKWLALRAELASRKAACI